MTKAGTGNEQRRDVPESKTSTYGAGVTVQQESAGDSDKSWGMTDRPKDGTAAAASMKRLRLGEPHFRALVRGGVVRIGDVEILLADIGFHPMRRALVAAERGIHTYKGYEDDDQ